MFHWFLFDFEFVLKDFKLISNFEYGITDKSMYGSWIETTLPTQPTSFLRFTLKIGVTVSLFRYWWTLLDPSGLSSC